MPSAGPSLAASAQGPGAAGSGTGQRKPLNGATVTGSWSRSGLLSDTCTTGDLGGNGTCIVMLTGIRKGTKSVSFTVTGVTKGGVTYDAARNHDPDGDSNGTTITVRRP